MVLKWGVAGAGKISHDFCNSLNMMNKDDHKIVAVSARDLERALNFANLHAIDRHYGSYDDLAHDNDIDIVYIGAVHTSHFPICKLMINAGKHVLCEKPLTINYKQTAEIIALAQSKKRFLMEGVWSRFTPAYRKLKSEIEKGTLGDVKTIVATFCKKVNSDRVLLIKDIGAGCILDIGIYLLQLSSFVFGNSPSSTHFAGYVTDNGVDHSCSMILQYENGTKVANLICDARVKGENCAYIMGTGGTIKLGDPFHTPTDLEMPDGQHHNYPLGKSPMPMIFPNSENFVHEIKCVGECIKNGKLECEVMPHCDSLHLAEMMDKARASLGVRYKEDDE